MFNSKEFKEARYNKFEIYGIALIILLIYSIWICKISVSNLIAGTNKIGTAINEASIMSIVLIAYIIYNRKIFESNTILAAAYFCHYLMSANNLSGNLSACYMIAATISYFRIRKETDYVNKRIESISSGRNNIVSWLDDIQECDVDSFKMSNFNTVIIYGFMLTIIVSGTTRFRSELSGFEISSLDLFMMACITLLPQIISLLAIINSSSAQSIRTLYYACMIYSYVGFYLRASDISGMYMTFMCVILMSICMYSINYNSIKSDYENSRLVKVKNISFGGIQ